MRGHHGQPPVEPIDALGILLRTVGHEGGLPNRLDEGAAPWRSYTAHHAALVVIDDTPVMPSVPRPAGAAEAPTWTDLNRGDPVAAAEHTRTSRPPCPRS